MGKGRDYNQYVGVGGQNTRNAFGFGRVASSKGSLSNVSGGKKDANEQTQSNLRGIVSLGLGFNIAQKLNEGVGAYTNDRLRQRRINTAMTGAKYVAGFATVGLVGGAVYMASDLSYRGMMYGIKLQKRNREAQYNERLSGINTNSGSRYRGDYL